MYVLQLSANGVNTTINASKNYTNNTTVILGYIFTTNILIDNDPNSLPFFLVKIILPNGSIINEDIRNTSVNYTLKGLSGENFSLKSLSDDENLILTINFDKIPLPPQPPSPPSLPTPPIPPTPIISHKTVKNHGSAEMKETGIPIIAIFTVLLSSIGITIFRKK